MNRLANLLLIEGRESFCSTLRIESLRIQWLGNIALALGKNRHAVGREVNVMASLGQSAKEHRRKIGERQRLLEDTIVDKNIRGDDEVDPA